MTTTTRSSARARRAPLPAPSSPAGPATPRLGAYRPASGVGGYGPSPRAHRRRPVGARRPFPGRAGGPSAAVLRRRLVLGTAAAAVTVILALPWGGAGGRLLATPGAALAGAPVAHHVLYVVQPGDSLWSIAERLDPGGDPRPIVAVLARQVGGDTVSAGERLTLP